MRLNRLFGWMDRKDPTPPERSTEWCQEITDAEREFLNANNWKCPDCKSGTLMLGPEGGCSVNVECNHCAAMFNLSASESQPLFSAPCLKFTGQRLRVGHPTTLH